MKANKLTLVSIFIALGIALPSVTHFIAAGNVLLPMHLTIFIAGCILKPKYAVIVGALTPILSSLLTQMPPAYPMLPIMVFELAAYALVISYLRNVYKLNIYLCLILSMVVGRIVAMLVVLFLIVVFKEQMSAIPFIVNAVKTGIIGIVIQLLIVPPIVISLEKSGT